MYLSDQTLARHVCIVSPPRDNCCFVLFFFLPCHKTRWILVPWPGIEPMPPVVETWSPNYWAAREFPLDNGSKLAHLHHCYSDAVVPGEVKKWSQMKSLSRVWLSVTPWTVAYQAPLSMGFSRQDYWNGLPFPSPRDLPDSGIEPMWLKEAPSI